jgi:hypothetical protein
MAEEAKQADEAQKVVAYELRPDMTPEERNVIRRREREARQAGLEPQDAFDFARSHEDVGLLRRLVRDGATPDQIARIVLPL